MSLSLCKVHSSLGSSKVRKPFSRVHPGGSVSWSALARSVSKVLNVSASSGSGAVGLVYGLVVARVLSNASLFGPYRTLPVAGW